MIDKKDEKKVREIVQDEYDGMFDDNYYSGAPKIPPHTHNGVDNLFVDAVLSVTAGSGITVSPANGVGNITISSAGGSPGGVNGDLQINASGTFGTIGGLNLDQTGNARGTNALDIQSKRSAVTQVASATESVTIGNGNTASALDSSAVGINNTASGQSAVAYGESNTAVNTNDSAIGVSNDTTGSGGSSSAIGSGNVASGTGSSAVGRANTASNSTSSAFGFAATASGSNSLAVANRGTASATNSGIFAIADSGSSLINNTANSILIGLNTASAHGQIQISGSSFAFFNATNAPSYGGGAGVIFITNDFTDPTSDPVGGGILYVSSGALMYRGSSGTITVLGPA